jgi:hypothetical protein
MAEEVENGLKAAVAGLSIGFVWSVLFYAFVKSAMGESGNNIAFLMNLASILIGVVQLERARYWGLIYSFGYFGGLFLVGNYFMEGWERQAYLLIIGLYIVQKIARKVRNQF